jgi:hypothetical protein
MSSLVVGLAVLALILVRQVRPRPLSNGLVVVLVLGLLGLAETGAFLFGQHQFGQFVTGHDRHLNAVVPDPRMVIAAAAGSLLLAAATGALRAPSVRLWRQGGQVWQRGTAVTVVLWLVSLGLHLGYDALVTRGSDAGFGDATLMLYFAVSIAAQRAVLAGRARRLGGPTSPGSWT